MVIKIQTWRPDTCECVINQQYDDQADPIVLTVHSVQNRCSQHSSLTNNTDLYDVVNEENPRRNFAFGHILDNAPTPMYDLQEDGSRTFKKGITVDWAYTGTIPNRVLTITVTGITLTTNQKNAIQTKLNERFGINNVVIVN